MGPLEPRKSHGRPDFDFLNNILNPGSLAWYVDSIKYISELPFVAEGKKGKKVSCSLLDNLLCAFKRISM